MREAAEAWCREEGLSVYDRGDHDGLLRNLVVREGRRTGTVQARIVTSRGDFRTDEFAAALPADGVLWTQIEGVAETTFGGKTKKLKGPAAIEEQIEIAGTTLRFKISPDALLPDEHRDGRAPLRARRPSWPGLSGTERVYDLYCGIGTISLALALESREVIGVELVERAVADAIENAKLNGVDNARFYAGDIRTAMRPLIEEEGKADVVVIDPPRAGLSQKVVRRVLEVEAKKIVYVSCNPTTLAPNARQMVDAGYELKTVRPVDMFPQTPHIESVACWSAAGLSSSPSTWRRRAATGGVLSLVRLGPACSHFDEVQSWQRARRSSSVVRQVGVGTCVGHHRGVELDVGVHGVLNGGDRVGVADHALDLEARRLEPLERLVHVPLGLVAAGVHVGGPGHAVRRGGHEQGEARGRLSARSLQRREQLVGLRGAVGDDEDVCLVGHWRS